jgi:hypothetical protein
MSKVDVVHNSDKQCFTVLVNNSQAILEYELLPNTTAGVQVIDFNHTYVPTECRGKGIAEALVREGLHWAKEQGYSIKASCWYVQKFIR